MEAIRYRLPISERSRRSKQHVHEKGIEGRVSVSGESAAELMRANQQAYQAGRGSATTAAVPALSAAPAAAAAPQQEPEKPEETPEEKLQREEEEARAKLEEEKNNERKREAAKNDPCNQKRRWLAGVSNLMESVKQQADIATTADRLPEPLAPTYEKDLKNYNKLLSNTRRKLENTADREKLAQLMVGAKQLVESARASMKAFKGLYSTYYPKSAEDEDENEGEDAEA